MPASAPTRVVVAAFPCLSTHEGELAERFESILTPPTSWRLLHIVLEQALHVRVDTRGKPKWEVGTLLKDLDLCARTTSVTANTQLRRPGADLFKQLHFRCREVGVHRLQYLAAPLRDWGGSERLAQFVPTAKRFSPSAIGYQCY